MPGRTALTSGAWPASTPKSPSAPGTSTWLTRPENRIRSGETRSNWKVAMMRFALQRQIGWRRRSPPPDRRRAESARRQSTSPFQGEVLFASGGLRRQLLTLVDGLLDGADHVEGGLRQVVVLAFAQPLEAADGVGELDEHAGRTGEHFGDVERLRKKALDLAGARDRELVLFRELVHAENGDDVLQRLVALQNLLHLACDAIMLLADDHRRQHAR